MTEITADSRVVVMSGTGVLSREMFDAMLDAVIPPGMTIDFRDDYSNAQTNAVVPPPPPVLTEVQEWNAEVDERKARKAARRAARI